MNHNKIYLDFIFSVPLRLSGEGSYALSAVKEISVTEDFLQLADETRKCQNRESFEQCSTKHHLVSIKKVCECIPYGMKNFSFNEVSDNNCLTSICRLLFHFHLTKMQLGCPEVIKLTGQ